MPTPAIGAHTEADFGPRTSNGECVSGSCNDGFGTIRYPDGTEITGRHVNGRQISGTYEIRWACQPDTTFPMTYDDSGKYVMGTVIRTCFNDANKLSAPARITSYTGTFTTITNPFTREEISSYKTGSYMDSRGIVWEGEFDYIPVKDSVDLPGYGETLLRSGAFVFIGAKIDPELNEVVRGLFISEPTRPGQEIYLTRARPDYLAKLRSTFVANRNQNATEIAEDERASRELFSTIATIVTSAAVMYGTYKLAEMSDRSAMDSMTNVIKGVKSPAVANAALPQTQNGSAVKSARPVTVAEYRNLQRDAQATQDARPQAQSQLRAQQEREQKRVDNERRDQEVRDNSERKRVAEAAAAKQKSETAAAKLAEQQAEKQAREQYLKRVASGTRLVAIKCPDGEGKYYATGSRPSIKPEVVGCVDVHFRAYCSGSTQYSNVVAHNFIGMSGCFGDTYDINPKPACKVDQVRIDVVEARACGG